MWKKLHTTHIIVISNVGPGTFLCSASSQILVSDPIFSIFTLVYADHSNSALQIPFLELGCYSSTELESIINLARRAVLVLENLNNFRLDLGKFVNWAQPNEPKSTCIFLFSHKTALRKHIKELFFSTPIPNHCFERHNLF